MDEKKINRDFIKGGWGSPFYEVISRHIFFTNDAFPNFIYVVSIWKKTKNAKKWFLGVFLAWPPFCRKCPFFASKSGKWIKQTTFWGDVAVKVVSDFGFGHSKSHFRAPENAKSAHLKIHFHRPPDAIFERYWIFPHGWGVWRNPQKQSHLAMFDCTSD